MQVTDEMVRVAKNAAAQHSYDLPYPLVEQMLTAALAAMWRDIKDAQGSKTVLGYQSSAGDFEGQIDICWNYGPENNPIWIGGRGLMPDFYMPLPSPPTQTGG